MKRTTTRNRKHPASNGGKWIRPEKKLAIFLRDGMTCIYCGYGIVDEISLTLDHVKPCSKNGSNEPDNLLTACKSCNSIRQDMALSIFVRKVASWYGESYATISKRIARHRKRAIDVQEARKITLRYRFAADRYKAAAKIS